MCLLVTEGQLRYFFEAQLTSQSYHQIVLSRAERRWDILDQIDIEGMRLHSF